MAKYQTLPILRDARLLMVEVEQVVRDFPKYHKYTLGTELRQGAMSIYSFTSRAIHYQKWRKKYGWLKCLYRLHDYKLYQKFQPSLIKCFSQQRNYFSYEFKNYICLMQKGNHFILSALPVNHASFFSHSQTMRENAYNPHQ